MSWSRPADARSVDYAFVGFNKVLGHRVVAWRPGYVEMTLEPRAELFNAGGVVHGGVLMSLLDSACGIAASYDEATGRRRYSLTLSFTTQFLKAARGGALTIFGRKRGGGRNIFVCEAEIRDGEGDTVATATGTFRYRTTERHDSGPTPDPQVPDIAAG